MNYPLHIAVFRGLILGLARAQTFVIFYHDNLNACLTNTPCSLLKIVLRGRDTISQCPLTRNVLRMVTRTVHVLGDNCASHCEQEHSISLMTIVLHFVESIALSWYTLFKSRTWWMSLMECTTPAAKILFLSLRKHSPCSKSIMPSLRSDGKSSQPHVRVYRVRYVTRLIGTSVNKTLVPMREA